MCACHLIILPCFSLQFFERLTVLLQLAGNIPYSQLEGLCVAVLLGSSAMRPREVYCLHFPHMSHQSGKQYLLTVTAHCRLA
jgi:hypothetical protein